MLIELGSTPNIKLQMRDGNSPATPDSSPTFAIYGAGDTPVSTGSMVGPIDSKAGLYRLGQEFSEANGFARGSYTMLVMYQVSTVPKTQEYSIQVV